MNEEKLEFDLDALAHRIVTRLDALVERADIVNDDLRALVGRVRVAVETGDAVMQWGLLNEIRTFLDGSMEMREEIRNVLHMFTLYVHLRNDTNDDGENE